MLNLRTPRALDAFPGLSGRGMLSPLAMPTATLKTALKWLWLQWHAGAAYPKILKSVTMVVERSLDAAARAPNDPQRGEHDAYTQMAAILSGSVELAYMAAEASTAAKADSRAKQFYPAWAGILKFRLLDKQADELKQLAVLKKNKGAGMSAEPSNALAEAFCKRNYGALAAEAGKSSARIQKEAVDLGTLKTKGKTSVLRLTGTGKVFHLRWPWPAAAFLKLAVLEEAEVKFDDFWIPEGFLNEWWK